MITFSYSVPLKHHQHTLLTLETTNIIQKYSCYLTPGHRGPTSQYRISSKLVSMKINKINNKAVFVCLKTKEWKVTSYKSDLSNNPGAEYLKLGPL